MCTSPFILRLSDPGVFHAWGGSGSLCVEQEPSSSDMQSTSPQVSTIDLTKLRLMPVHSGRTDRRFWRAAARRWTRRSVRVPRPGAGADFVEPIATPPQERGDQAPVRSFRRA
jgi:hypothetical protein